MKASDNIPNLKFENMICPYCISQYGREKNKHFSVLSCVFINRHIHGDCCMKMCNRNEWNMVISELADCPKFVGSNRAFVSEQFSASRVRSIRILSMLGRSRCPMVRTPWCGSVEPSAWRPLSLLLRGAASETLSVWGSVCRARATLATHYRTSRHVSSQRVQWRWTVMVSGVPVRVGREKLLCQAWLRTNFCVPWCCGSSSKVIFVYPAVSWSLHQKPASKEELWSAAKFLPRRVWMH